MRRVYKCFFAVFLLITAFTTLGFAQKAVDVAVNSRLIVFPDAKPFIDGNNQILIPINQVGEALRAKVDWDSAAKQVTVERGQSIVTMTIGKKQITVDGRSKTINTAAVIKNNKNFIPVKPLAEALGGTLYWQKGISRLHIGLPNRRLIVYESGFKIRDDSDVIISSIADDPVFESVINLSLMRSKYTSQVLDIGATFKDRYNDEIGRALHDYMITKTEIKQKLPEKVFHIETAQQYVWMQESTDQYVRLYITKPGAVLPLDSGGKVKLKAPKVVENVNGYKIPFDTEVTIALDQNYDQQYNSFLITSLRPDYEKQLKDLHEAISSKHGEKTANEILSHVRNKKARWDLLSEKTFVSKVSNQELTVLSSRAASISIIVMNPGVKR